MCNFISWIECEKNVYVITDAEFKSERGKELIKESGSFQDIWGHGFCRRYFELKSEAGIEKENNVPFKNLKLLPKEIQKLLKNLRKNFNEMFKTGGSLDVSGCDLKGVTLPTDICGSLDVRGCDLKGITLPTKIGGWLDVRGCDLKGVTLSTKIGSLEVRGCDLKGVTLPKNIKIIR